MGTYNYTHQCPCDGTVIFSVTNADAQAWKDDANFHGGHAAGCPSCGCYFRTVDDGVDVGSGGGIEIANESRPRLDSLSAATSGPLGGGTTVRIEGHGFDHVEPVVTFDGVSGTNIVVITPDSLDVDAPAGSLMLNMVVGPHQQINHGGATGGPFQVGEVITGNTSSVSAIVVEQGVSHLVFKSATGAFQDGETVTGSTSAATATISSVTVPVFEDGEVILGLTGGATAVLSDLPRFRVTSVSDTFLGDEEIKGLTSGAIGTLAADPANGFVDVAISNQWGAHPTSYRLVNAFEYTQ